MGMEGKISFHFVREFHFLKLFFLNSGIIVLVEKERAVLKSLLKPQNCPTIIEFS